MWTILFQVLAVFVISASSMNLKRHKESGLKFDEKDSHSMQHLSIAVLQNIMVVLGSLEEIIELEEKSCTKQNLMSRGNIRSGRLYGCHVKLIESWQDCGDKCDELDIMSKMICHTKNFGAYMSACYKGLHSLQCAADEYTTSVNPGATGPMTPGATDPTTAGPTTPGAAGPMTPGAAGPTTPGVTGPTNPGVAGPTAPGAAGPTTPGAAGPTIPGATGPTTPGVTDPTNPVVTDPTNPVVTDPTNPGVTDPTNPGITDPTNPGITDPVDPEVPDPVDPDQYGRFYW